MSFLSQRSYHRRYNWFLTIPVFALTVIAMLFSVFSFVNLRANVALAESSDSTASLTLDPVIDISAPSSITINCTPGTTDATAQLCTQAAAVTINTNNATGYTLYMNATNGSSTSLTNSATSPAATISTLSQSYPAANFPVNSWGYTGGTDKSSESGGYNCASNYCPILAYSGEGSYAPNHTINATDGPSASSTTNLTFGAKVNTTKPSGTYTTSVTFTAVANALPGPSLDGMNMQDIDSSVCASVTDIGTTYTVVDTRGGGTNYTVAKLQDGNCWMTQNLELGQTGQSLNLTSDTSNVSSNGYTLTLDTEQSHYKGDSSTKYGNFYTFAQATAGSGTSTAGEDAPYDICPKNWRLPSASSTGATDSEFYVMLNNYLDSSKWDSSNNRWSGLTTTEFTNPPVSLVFSGFWDTGSLYSQGDEGTWWSSTSNGSSYAFYLGADPYGYVTPRYDYFQTYGYSVRCLVPSS